MRAAIGEPRVDTYIPPPTELVTCVVMKQAQALNRERMHILGSCFRHVEEHDWQHLCAYPKNVPSPLFSQDDLEYTISSCPSNMSSPLSPQAISLDNHHLYEIKTPNKDLWHIHERERHTTRHEFTR